MKLSALAKKNFTQSKSIIFMIALASMLVCCVLNLGISAQISIVENILEFTGDNQVKYKNLTEDEISRISNRSEVALADVHYYVEGFAVAAADASASIEMIYSSELGNVANFRITNGRGARAVNEAVISPHLAVLLGVEPKVGEEFEAVYYLFDEDGNAMEIETLRFVVSGVLQEQRMYAAMNVYHIYVSKSFAERHEHHAVLFLRFNNRTEPRAASQRIADEFGIAPEDTALNEDYLRANLNDPTVIIFASAVSAILLAAGALVIYNAYSLAIVRKVHQYGLLTVIGASKRQIKRCLYLEALFCAGAGLPLGLLAGTLFGFAGMEALNGISGIPMPYVVTPLAFAASALVVLIMTWLGVTGPARKASLIAPVEAVRFIETEEQLYKRRAIENITLNALVKINMSRSKKRLAGTVLSLSLSGVLFLSFSSVAFSMRGSAGNLVAQSIAGDIVITAGEFGTISNPHSITPGLTEAISELDGVESAAAFAVQYFADCIEYNGETFTTNGQKAAGVSADIMRSILNKVYDGNPTLDDFDDPINVIAEIPSVRTMDFYERSNPEYIEKINRHSVGAKITLDLLTVSDGNWEMGETVTLRIVGLVRADDIPPYVMYDSYLPKFYLPQKSFEANGWESNYERLILTVGESGGGETLRAVEALCAPAPELAVQSFAAYRDELVRQMTGVIIIVTLMLGVVALNGVMNLVGTTYMGIERRKRELGTLMAVGMSRKAVGKLLTREGIWISAICSLISAAGGLGAGFGLCRLMYGAGADYLEFIFPLLPLAALLLVTGTVPCAVSMLAAKKLKSSTIVELLGNSV